MSAIIPFPDKFPPRTERRMPAERSEMIAALVSAGVILSESKDPIGRVFREGLVGRIRDIVASEGAA